MERRNKKFMVALTPSERAALQRLAHRERISAGAVVRRLVWKEAERLGVVSQDTQGSQGKAGSE